MQREKFLVGLRRGLWLELGGDDVEHGFKMIGKTKPREHRAGVIGRAIREDQLAPRQFCDCSPHRGIRLQRRVIDLVDVSEIIIRMHAMLGHHAAHGGAVAPVIILLDAARFLGGYAEKARDELTDPRIDLLPQIDVMRIQRVVEVEHPGVDVAEGAG